jgi:hypothetical protein
MSVAIPALLTAAPFYGLWFISLVLQSLLFNIVLFIVSVANFLLYLFPSKPRQLFFADSSVLARTSHAHQRSLAARPRAWRPTIGTLLRGSDSPTDATDFIVELNVWQRNEICEAILIVFSPITAGLPLMFSTRSREWLLLGSVLVGIFLLVLVNHFRLVVEDQKLIGEDLYKTQRRALQEGTAAAAVQQYSGRCLQRRAQYTQGMPMYGPGADLTEHFGFQRPESETESDSGDVAPEVCVGEPPKRSPRSQTWSRRPAS